MESLWANDPLRTTRRAQEPPRTLVKGVVMVRVRIATKIAQNAAQSLAGCVIDGGCAAGKQNPALRRGCACGSGQRSPIAGLLSVLCFLRGPDGRQHLLVQSGAILAAKQR